MKKLAVVVGGWHYPLDFYLELAAQNVAEGWEYKFFVVGHRSYDEPVVATEKKWIKDLDRPYIWLDKTLYNGWVTTEILRKLGYSYSLEPNTIGDLEFFNQWLDKNQWQEYDMFLFAHDDTALMSYNFIKDVLEKRAVLYKKEEDGVVTIDADSSDEWVWLSNSTTDFYYHIRNSLDFISPEVVRHVNGHFDISVNLTRVGLTDTPAGHMDLADWNKWIRFIQDTLKDMGRIQDVRFLSKDYRISDYAIEGERGMISNMNADTRLFLEGLEARGIKP
jgi:hypothetical protein